MDSRTLSLYFSLFNEIGIINQLASTMLENRLPDGLLVSHFAVLNHLIRVADGQTPLVLARAFQVPKTTMSHTLATLARRGLVAFRPNPKDARSKRVHITEAGRRCRDDAIAALGPDMARLADLVPPERIEGLVEPLGEIRALLDRARDGEPETG